MTSAGFTGLAIGAAMLLLVPAARASEVTIGEGRTAGGVFQLQVEQRTGPEKVRELCLRSRFRITGFRAGDLHCEPLRRRPLVGPHGGSSSCHPRVSLVAGFASSRVDAIVIEFVGGRKVRARLFDVPVELRVRTVAYFAAARTAQSVRSVSGYDSRGRRIHFERETDELEEFLEGPRCSAGDRAEKIALSLPVLVEGDAPGGGTFVARGGPIRLRSGRRVTCMSLEVTNATIDGSQAGFGCGYRPTRGRLLDMSVSGHCGDRRRTFAYGLAAPDVARVELEFHDGRRAGADVLPQRVGSGHFVVIALAGTELPRGVVTLDASRRLLGYARVSRRRTEPCTEIPGGGGLFGYEVD